MGCKQVTPGMMQPDMNPMPRDETAIRIRNLKYLLVSLVVFAALVLYASSYTEPVLRVSYLPDESPSFMRRKFKPLTDYLEEKIGMKIEFRPMRNGDALVEALIDNKMDMVWIDGFNFIRAKARSNDQVIPLVQRAEDAQTTSVFITAQRGITSLEDLKDKTIAYGTETSASGYVMPRVFIQAAYIDPDIDMRHIFFSTPEATVAAVADGAADAGVLGNAAWDKLIELGKVDRRAVRVFYVSPVFHDYNWAVRADMDVNLRLKLADAFLALDRNNGKDKEILDLQRASRFITTNVDNYSAIEAAARRPRSSP